MEGRSRQASLDGTLIAFRSRKEGKSFRYPAHQFELAVSEIAYAQSTEHNRPNSNGIGLSQPQELTACMGTFGGVR